MRALYPAFRASRSVEGSNRCLMHLTAWAFARHHGLVRIMVPIPSWLGMLRANVIMRTLVDWWRGNNMPGVKRKVLHSIIRFWFYALYLFVIFGMLALHEAV